MFANNLIAWLLSPRLLPKQPKALMTQKLANNLMMQQYKQTLLIQVDVFNIIEGFGLGSTT